MRHLKGGPIVKANKTVLNKFKSQIVMLTVATLGTQL